MTPRSNAAISLGLVLAVAFRATGEAQEVAPGDEPTTLRELIDAAVEQIEVYPDAASKQPAKPLVVLRWANNQRGSEDGLTMLYIHSGKPLAAACLYPWDGKLVHDCEAVNRGKLVARRNGSVIWQPQETGVHFADIAEAPVPAATRSLRLRQIKSLAEEFQSTMVGWKGDSSDREELRMLPRPLYRYEPAEGDTILDGAVFAFAMGTDPESLLFIEAIHAAEGPKWQFAFARRTSGELEGRHRDKVVWTADRYPDTKDPRKARFGVGTPIPPKVLAALEGETTAP
jgi:hypothetical protein